MEHPIYIQRIYEEPARNEGYRVLVDRLWPRGLSKERARLDEWLKEIAPSPQLRKWFHHNPERFSEFSTLYKAELAGRDNEIRKLTEMARQQPLTLLYAAKDEQHNHAIVLKEYLEEQFKMVY